MIRAEEIPGSGICAVCKLPGGIHYGYIEEIPPVRVFLHYWFCEKHYREFIGGK